MKFLTKTLWIAPLLLSAALVTSGQAASTDCTDEAHYPQISKADLKKLADNKAAFIVDVNSEESYKGAHVPGAIHYESNRKEFAKLLPKDKNAQIVAYCGGLQCTAWKTAAEEACKMGYTQISHFKPGISGWLKKN